MDIVSERRLSGCHGARRGSRNMSLVYGARHYSTRTLSGVEIRSRKCISFVKNQTKQTGLFSTFFPPVNPSSPCFEFSDLLSHSKNKSQKNETKKQQHRKNSQWREVGALTLQFYEHNLGGFMLLFLERSSVYTLGCKEPSRLSLLMSQLPAFFC